MGKMANIYGKQRNDALDLIKGICIILVVLSHTITFKPFPELIRSIFIGIYLNAFFAVTGYIIEMRYRPLGDIKGNIINKFISLIIPYVCFSILAIVWQGVLAVCFDCTVISPTYTGYKLVFRNIFCFISGLGIGVLWFLPVLFCAYTMVAVTRKATESMPTQIRNLVYIILIVGALIISVKLNGIHFQGDGLVVKIENEFLGMLYRISYGYSYALLGGVIFNTYITIKERRALIFAAELGLFILSIFFYQKGMKSGFEVSLCSYVLISALLLFRNNKISQVIGPIIYCGKNSLAIMILHSLFLLPPQQMIIEKALGGGVQSLRFSCSLSILHPQL